ncbi:MULTISPECIES: lytic transglycosylase domain-containing protein [Algibacter]|uniref:Membrane-bound lytic murein transglycosylase D n=1 Tax=Algibacter lectus TaxID=221126 RepID=A0A090WM90_9FLAO|nr:lytic transglycosylase domain-containing protein [Algibacter lectus]MDO7137658.1 lytic transglycosylase domain-containing protein [Algibacter lectus]MWW25542.1 transglycosylase SLT domain-containing protein [Algibacter lectus]TDY61488.1 transglycosylase-like protein with SLT domain [Algibacter lectus]SFD11604.1 Transglycosylase SLT domain-containing protein [Algibacter lectus]GAL78210.1 membrane-bound lytic murein transglycosylase D precursor [Algibacter lectus]
MKIVQKTLALVGLLSLCALFINAFQEAPTDENFETKLINDYNVYALQVPEKLDFAGEPMPLDNPDILERMDRELLVNTYWQSNGLLMFKRSKKYFPIIEPILAKHGVPDDFKYLAVIESGLTNAVSPAGARGFWQIMPATGRENGLEVNNNVDERYNLEMATEVACRYLLRAKEQLGSWTLAAAAYNAGNAGVSRRLKEQNVSEYYDLLLGEETGRYMFRIVALKEILSNPDTYGFNFRDKDLYTPVPTYKVEVDTAVTDFTKFAENYGINYKILKLHNPWLREPHLNNRSRKQYYIDIPEEGYYN